MEIDRSNALMVLIATTLLVGCGPAESFDSEFRDQAIRARDARERLFASGYFPPSFADPQFDCGSSDRKSELIGSYEAEWYPREWKAAREPSFYLLSKQEKPPEFALRFTYIPSFAASVFIRIQKEGDEYWLIVKEMDGASGFDKGRIARSKKDRLSSRQVSELKRLLAEEALFSEAPGACGSGLDGSGWIFEMIDPNGYRMVKRWTPTQGAGYNLGQYLIELSNWNLNCLSSLPRPFSDVELFCD